MGIVVVLAADCTHCAFEYQETAAEVLKVLCCDKAVEAIRFFLIFQIQTSRLVLNFRIFSARCRGGEGTQMNTKGGEGRGVSGDAIVTLVQERNQTQ